MLYLHFFTWVQILKCSNLYRASKDFCLWQRTFLDCRRDYITWEISYKFLSCDIFLWTQEHSLLKKTKTVTTSSTVSVILLTDVINYCLWQENIFLHAKISYKYDLLNIFIVPSGITFLQCFVKYEVYCHDTQYHLTNSKNKLLYLVPLSCRVAWSTAWFNINILKYINMFWLNLPLKIQTNGNKVRMKKRLYEISKPKVTVV